MSKSAVSYRRQQEKVNDFFQSQSQSLFWRDIYASRGVQAEIYRTRHAAALAWIDGLALAPGSCLLEIGCGAGFMSIALAQRGFCVQAIDSVDAMVQQTRQHAEEYGVTDLLSVDVGNAYSLAFEDGSFDLVLALGVIPWLSQPEVAIQEMARVTKPGGYIFFTADNRTQLRILLDPWLNPALVPLRNRVRAMLERIRLRQPVREESVSSFHSFHTPRFIDNALASIGLIKIRSTTLGFGPFTFRDYRVVPEPLGLALHYGLQRLADRNLPWFRSSGSHYLVLARKPISQLPETAISAVKSVSDAAKAL